MIDLIDPEVQIRGMLAKGWSWSDNEENLLVHPEDHGLSVRYDPTSGKMFVSPELDTYLRLLLPMSHTKKHSR